MSLGHHLTFDVRLSVRPPGVGRSLITFCHIKSNLTYLPLFCYDTLCRHLHRYICHNMLPCMTNECTTKTNNNTLKGVALWWCEMLICIEKKTAWRYQMVIRSWESKNDRHYNCQKKWDNRPMIQKTLHRKLKIALYVAPRTREVF